MSVINAETTLAPVDKLRPHPRNPRRGDVDAIAESIKQNGFYGTIVAQRSTGHILAGNHRWEAAKQADISEVPVTWVDVDDDRALRILLVDNRTNDLSSYDHDELVTLLQAIGEDTGTLDGTGWTENALLELLGESETGEPPDMSIPERYDVLIECKNETEQASLLDRLQAEGYSCRALIS